MLKSENKTKQKNVKVPPILQMQVDKTTLVVTMNLILLFHLISPPLKQ
jgi:hypothetical protein